MNLINEEEEESFLKRKNSIGKENALKEQVQFIQKFRENSIQSFISDFILAVFHLLSIEFSRKNSTKNKYTQVLDLHHKKTKIDIFTKYNAELSFNKINQYIFFCVTDTTSSNSSKTEVGEQDESHHPELAGNSKLLRKKNNRASFMQKTSVAVPPPSVKRFSFNGLTPADEKVDKNTKKSLKLKNNVQVSNSLTVPSMVIF